MRFRAEVRLGGKTATGFEVPDEVVASERAIVRRFGSRSVVTPAHDGCRVERDPPRTAPLCQELWRLFPPGDCVVVLAGVKAEPFGWLRQP
jgi:hypothetical protein